MASNVKEQLIEKVKASKYYSIQMDESTDFRIMAHLLTFIRFEDEESIKEELFCEPLLGRTTSNDIFKKIRPVYEILWRRMDKMFWSLLRWSTCNDGKVVGVVAQIKEVAPDAKFVHCTTHRGVLAARKMPAISKTVMTKAVKVVNFIKSRETNSRLFSILCNEMGSEHDKLFVHTEVRGNVLSRLFELRSEVRIFLSDTTSDL
jgi:hypothetical protein